jgi:hypothetical protein
LNARRGVMVDTDRQRYSTLKRCDEGSDIAH